MQSTGELKWYLDSIANLEDYYKFSIGLMLGINSGQIKVKVPSSSTYGKYTLGAKELTLDDDQEKRSAWISHNNAVLVLAIQLAKFMQKFATRRIKKDKDLKHAFIIIKHIRNAWAHGPFDPVWEIKKEDERVLLKVENIIELDARELDGKAVLNRQFGYSHALLKLSEYIRNKFQFSQSQSQNNQEPETPPH